MVYDLKNYMIPRIRPNLHDMLFVSSPIFHPLCVYEFVSEKWTSLYPDFPPCWGTGKVREINCSRSSSDLEETGQKNGLTSTSGVMNLIDLNRFLFIIYFYYKSFLQYTYITYVYIQSVNVGVSRKIYTLFEWFLLKYD